MCRYIQFGKRAVVGSFVLCTYALLVAIWCFVGRSLGDHPIIFAIRSPLSLGRTARVCRNRNLRAHFRRERASPANRKMLKVELPAKRNIRASSNSLP